MEGNVCPDEENNTCDENHVPVDVVVVHVEPVWLVVYVSLHRRVLLVKDVLDLECKLGDVFNLFLPSVLLVGVTSTIDVEWCAKDEFCTRNRALFIRTAEAFVEEPLRIWVDGLIRQLCELFIKLALRYH